MNGVEAKCKQKRLVEGFHLLKRRFPREAAAFAPAPLAKVPEAPGVPEMPPASRSVEIAKSSSPGDCVVDWLIGRGVV